MGSTIHVKKLEEYPCSFAYSPMSRRASRSHTEISSSSTHVHAHAHAHVHDSSLDVVYKQAGYSNLTSTSDENANDDANNDDEDDDDDRDGRQEIVTTKKRATEPKQTKKVVYLCLIMGEKCPWMTSKENRHFKNAAQVKEDILRHWNPFQCPKCGAKFGKSNGLTRHKKQTEKCRSGLLSNRKFPELSPKIQDRVTKLQDAKGIDQIKEAIKGWKEDFKTGSESTKSRGFRTPQKPATTSGKGRKVGANSSRMMPKLFTPDNSMVSSLQKPINSPDTDYSEVNMPSIPIDPEVAGGAFIFQGFSDFSSFEPVNNSDTQDDDHNMGFYSAPLRGSDSDGMDTSYPTQDPAEAPELFIDPQHMAMPYYATPLDSPMLPDTNTPRIGNPHMPTPQESNHSQMFDFGGTGYNYYPDGREGPMRFSEGGGQNPDSSATRPDSPFYGDTMDGYYEY